MTIVCPKCEKAHHGVSADRCPACGYAHVYDVEEQDALLVQRAMDVSQEIEEAGIKDVLKGIAGIVVRVQEGSLVPAVSELVSTTSMEHVDSFRYGAYSTAMLGADNTPFFLVREGSAPNPFRKLNIAPVTQDKPDARLETFIFETTDLSFLVEEQRNRGVRFMSKIMETPDFSYVQTEPSPWTHNSTGYVEFHGEKSFRPDGGKEGIPLISKPDHEHIRNLGFLDHTATRLTHLDRTPAILELVGLTGYSFSEAIYVKLFNSITNVNRLEGSDFAMVVTSGIKEYTGDPSVPEPTEKYVRNYGKRVHHIAWQSDPIDDVVQGLRQDGVDFLLDVVGGEDEGLKQTFTRPSSHTFLVNEYIHRYGDFKGFFTKSNVTKLTGATDRQ